MTKDKKKILVIADEHFDKSILYEALCHYALDIAHSTNEGIHLLDSQVYCAILIDYQLPSMSGLAALKQINQKTHQAIPSILILERGQEKIAVAAMKEGVSDYLVKTEMIPSILNMTVQRAIEHKKWERIYQSFSVQDENDASGITDPATELFNQHYFETRLREELKRSQRFNFPVSLIIFQVDQYNELSDLYGSSNVDTILKELGQLFSRNLRASDLIARIKENKFALLLPHTNVKQARIAWKRLEDEAIAYPIATPHANVYLTLKATVTCLNQEIEMIDQLIEDLSTFLQKQNPTTQSLSLYK